MDSAGGVLATKRGLLCEILAKFERVAIAFSGGVDSSYLLSACVDVLGAAQVLALTADSPLMPRAELRTARQIAESVGVCHRVLPLDDLAVPEVAANPPRRCYYCKRARFQALLVIASEAQGSQLLHGENADDHLDYRPGSAAAAELRVRAPLSEAGLTKLEIRELSRQRGLPTWDYPAAACLASRFPYNTPLSREGLERVERAEEVLRRVLPHGPVRLRDHYPVARVEVPPEEIERLAVPERRAQIARELRALGYHYVALDLDGYRMGSLNDGIETRITD